MKYKVLALNVHGHITYCTSPPELRGVGRCNHVAHQRSGESPQQFIERISDEAEKLQKNLDEKEPFIPEETVIETKPYRMTEEERKSLVKIENRMQLDQNIEGGYIEFEEPLWNDMDKKYFSQMSGISVKYINAVLHREAYIILKGDGRFKEGTIYTEDEVIEFEKNGFPNGWTENIVLDTGVVAMNTFAKENYDFEATKYVYVLPYYLRMGVADHTVYASSASESAAIGEREDRISSQITAGYKYLLRQRANPDRQQLAYDALLNNDELNKNYARYTDGFRNRSLADEFAGKGGVFRAHLSGSSIPYSGRAVIVPNANLKFGEVAIPASMAIDIFRPTLLKQLSSEGMSMEEIDEWMNRYRIPQNKIHPAHRKELDERIRHLRIAMNRQPSLHQSSFQTFRPRISSSASAEIHPLYCKAYNADFDGDTCSFYGFNHEEIFPILDRNTDASLDVNVTIPRHHDTVAIMPSKDALFGLLNILEQRGD